jgi:hypothetical protein
MNFKDLIKDVNTDWKGVLLTLYKQNKTDFKKWKKT